MQNLKWSKCHPKVPPNHVKWWLIYFIPPSAGPRARSRFADTRLASAPAGNMSDTVAHTPFGGPPPFSSPCAQHCGKASSLWARKDGRRAAATPPEPGRFSPELGPVRRARCAWPGPLEQPHHQQPALLPEQLLPVRAAPSAPGGVSFRDSDVVTSLPALCRSAHRQHNSPWTRDFVVFPSELYISVFLSLALASTSSISWLA